jgi:hypothetical protein
MRKQERLQVAVILCLAFTFILPAFSFADGQDHAELVKVATLPRYFAGTWPCFDGNHDGRWDVFGTYGPQSQAKMLVCEDTSGNSFRIDSTGLLTGRILDVGDADGDSLCDMVGSLWENSFKVWEAVAPDSFPSRLVFVDSPPCGAEYAQFCDLDQDGDREIVISGNIGVGVYVYENQEDNHYIEVPFPRRVTSGDVSGVFAVGDFDLDGHTELAGGETRGELLLYECTGDDQYARVCSLYYYPNGTEDYWHAAANDMDGDGLPKLISLFRRNDTQTDSCFIRIFEEPVHNQLVCVCSLTYAYDPFNAGCVAAGNVDGSGRDMFAVSTGIDVRLFTSTGIHQYAQIWQVNWPAVRWFRFFDVNKDSRDELLISCGDSTYIYEDTNGLGVTEFTRLPQLHTVTVQPTIARLGAPLKFSGISPGSDVEILSLDGRLVSRTQGVRQSEWSWDLRNQSGNLVPAGTYFAVIRSKGKSTSLKLCLVK